MSEFKFACPVCGQHITSDSSASGGQLECPTCFQKIVVPQAPSSPDAKFIISASQVGKPRPVSISPGEANPGPIRTGKTSLIATLIFFIVLVGAGAAAFVFRDKLFKKDATRAGTSGATGGVAKAVGPPPKVYPVPTNIAWSLELTNMTLPEATAAGAIHGSGFLCERAVLQGGHLILRQGSGNIADLGVTVQFFAQLGEELSGKKIEIPADRQPPLPKVIVRWKDANQKAVTRMYPSGYALKVVFGNAESGIMPGKIFLSVPDETKSVVAGSFEAEIRKPPPPKPKTPRIPKAPKTSG